MDCGHCHSGGRDRLHEHDNRAAGNLVGCGARRGSRRGHRGDRRRQRLDRSRDRRGSRRRRGPYEGYQSVARAFQLRSRTMNRLLGILVLAAAFAGGAVAQQATAVAGTAPGQAGVAQLTEVTATITAIDASTREVTLKGPQGNEVVVTAGPEVKNFDKMKVGDSVTVQYLSALSLELAKGGGREVTRTEQTGAAAAPKGSLPAGAVGRQVTVVADVINVNPATQTVTLRGPKRTVDVVVADPDQFKRVAKGDQVVATYTEAVAISVAPATPK